MIPNGTPFDPEAFLQNVQAASMLHDLYEAFTNAGFSNEQAFDLLLTILESGNRG
jgi:hypothetical protein